MVLQDGTQRPIEGANVRMIVGANEFITTTNANGYYQFPPVEEPALADNQAEYTVSLHAYMTDNKDQKSKPVLIKMVKGNKSANAEIKMENRGPVSSKAGNRFLAFLILVLIGLGFLYYHTHSPDDSKEEIDYHFVSLLKESLLEHLDSDSSRVANFELKNGKVDSLDSIFITNNVSILQQEISNLTSAARLKESYRTSIKNNLDKITQAITNHNKDGILASLRNTKLYVTNINSVEPSWFWRDKPYVYFEMILWALFATLIRLIGNTGYYVSRNMFFKDSISHKVPLLFTIPLIALLIGLIISFFKISIKIGDAGLELDFTDPYVSVILAALIGLAPWKAWEFMYGLADQLFQGLKNWLGLSKSGDTPSEGENGTTNGATNAGSNNNPPKIPPTDPPGPNPNDSKPDNTAEPTPKPSDGDTASGESTDTDANDDGSGIPKIT